MTESITEPIAQQPFDTSGFRRALGAFVTGVTVVTTIQPDGSPRGFTANSFTSVSLDPPLVLVCIAKTASSHPVFSATQRFAVSVLAENQADVSGVFASKAQDKFARVPWDTRKTGAPVIRDAAASFDCVTHDVVDAGDHIILIGRVVDFAQTSASPLGYCRGAYVNFSLSQDALSAAGRAQVGAILEHRDGLVLVDTPHGLRLPTGSRLEPASDAASLRGVLTKLGLNAHLDFLFAVFESAGGREPGVHIYYRGRVMPTGSPWFDSSIRIVPLWQVPWDDIADTAVRSMLERYVRERRQDAYGIYVGDTEAGTVQPLAAA
ncbi:flavin reductase [Burkholderia multivorans]|uniref:Nitrilotriacetate monooxygenase n=3 Tax=Burkholderia cepacia complex TaxID=87882 RepID=A0A0H3KUE7_BURM1|nr:MULTISPECIES: flavin reductase family protein [Burkholderia cepacia complex]ABX19772.1 flavin reductase domain protein FMN-binding [Burkholderia multivorans ATCC 17616]AIO71530.1 flavin reductase like domain protein [Burkholderia multivorans]AOK69602.1 flavin reductase [Burkholderia multivorans]AYY99450.1 flavin reductase [Burkholderia multivorans]EJO57608.1 flavin reductase-like domain protein [Burkholderia multivorans CF2]